MVCFVIFSARIRDAMSGSMLGVLLSRRSLWEEIHRFLIHFTVKYADLPELTRKMLPNIPFSPDSLFVYRFDTYNSVQLARFSSFSLFMCLPLKKMLTLLQNWNVIYRLTRL